MDYGMEGIAEPKASSSARPITEQGTPEDSGNTIHVPAEFLQGTKFKAGDELVLKVVSVDDEGLEVAYATKPESESASEESSANEEIDQLDDGE